MRLVASPDELSALSLQDARTKSVPRGECNSLNCGLGSSN